eukprot:scaffold764_cov248-Pinguiococcus_pyrenoidosus.AAC.38
MAHSDTLWSPGPSALRQREQSLRSAFLFLWNWPRIRCLSRRRMTNPVFEHFDDCHFSAEP